MDFIRLAASDTEISRIGFGCCPMGGHGWGETEDNELIRAAHTALDNGVNLFDTADVYGLGKSESLLGKALGSRRKQALIASKFGVRRSQEGHTFYDNSPEWIKTALTASLKRLGTDYIDLYQLHYWDTVTSFDAIFETLERLKEAGKIRYYGVTNMDPVSSIEGPPPDGLFSFSLEYSLAKRIHEATIDKLSKEMGLIFMSWGSLGQGIFSGRYDQSTIFPENDRRHRAIYANFHGEKLQNNMVILEKMREMLPRYPGKTIPQIALKWILERYDNSIALVGIKRPEQVAENIGATGWKMHKDDVAYLDLISR
jgi:aryl-alcohol dehydrogenase-like predicted oxidoreductase